MAAFDFPSSPTVGQTYTANGVTYQWNGVAWMGAGPLPSPSFIMSFRNKLINGSFIYWTRTGILNVTAHGYFADRWSIWFGSAGAGNMYYNPIVGNPDVGDGQSTTSVVWNQSTGSAGPYIYQYIEGVSSLAGKKVTVSFDCSYISGVAGITLTPRFAQYFGTGGSPSATVTTTGNPIPIPAGFGGRLRQTLQLPAITGKTIGSASDNFLRFDLVGPDNKTWGLCIGDVQVEEGEIDTPFERRPIEVEFDLCRRYFQRGQYCIGSADVAPSGISRGHIQFSPPMRRTPTGVTNLEILNINCASPVPPIRYITANGMHIYGAGSVANTAMNAEGTWTADAEF